MTLADLAIGVPATVTAVKPGSEVILRLMEMGLVAGASVEVRKIAPFGDPLQLRVRNYLLSIRKNEAAHFEVALTHAHV